MPEERSLFDGLGLRAPGHAALSLPFSVVAETEVDQPSEVDGGDAQRETELVPLHTSKSDSPVVVGHQPGDRSFHHRSPSSVVLGEVAFSPRPTGLDQFVVVRSEVERATVFGGGAPISQWAGSTPRRGSSARTLAVIETVWPAGQVAVRASSSTMKSSRLKPPGTAGGSARA